MKEQYLRTAALWGEDAIQKLRAARVAVIGIGGVGSYALEALARAGIGHITVVDSDTVDVTNINRQLIATHSTVGKYKVDVAAERIADIDPDITVVKKAVRVTPENAYEIASDSDYVVDAIDSVAAKLALVKDAKARGAYIISSMGTGNKCDPSRLCVSDISKTTVCPLARAVRTGLKKMGIVRLPVVFSTELPHQSSEVSDGNRRAPASNSFVPATAGLLLASEVIREILTK